MAFIYERDITYSAKKNVTMNFWLKRYKKTTVEKFCLFGITVEFVEDFTNLGYRMTCDLRDELDMVKQLKKNQYNR